MGLWDDSKEGQCDAGERGMARSPLNDFQMDYKPKFSHWRYMLSLVNLLLHKGLKVGFFIMRMTGLLCGKLDNINFSMSALPFNALLML